MYKKLPTLLILLALVACSSKRDSISNEAKVSNLANLYASYYEIGHYAYPPVLVVKVKKGIQEALYIDHKRERIGRRSYKETPFEQFLVQVKNNSNVEYSKAAKELSFSMLNYYAKDCPNIKKALYEIDNIDLSYKHSKPFHFLPENAAYSYLYLDKEHSSITHKTTTIFAEHPVSEIYRIAKKAIKECPYPQEPPKL